MFLRIFYSFILFFPTLVSSQIPLGIGQWRTHVPYKNATSLTDAGDKIYVSGNVFFFSYDKTNGQLDKYDKVTGLSDVGVGLVEYNPHNKTLLIAYDNTNIDLIENNTIINISDIKRKQIIGEKKINSVLFIGDFAYLSCSFGIVILDMAKKEIKDTYRIGTDGENLEVFSFAEDGVNFYAATAEGIKVASKNSPNLSNYSEWHLASGLTTGAAPNVVSFNGKIFANVKDTIFTFDGSTWDYYYAQSSWKTENMVIAEGQLIISESDEPLTYSDGRIGTIDSDFICCNYIYDPIRLPLDAVIDSSGVLWVADLLEGLIRISGDDISVYPPSGPGSTNVQSLAVERGQLWVGPGGVDQSYSFDGYNRDGVFSFSSNSWNNYNQFTNAEFDTIYNFWKVAVHPTLNRAYFGSWWGGLIEYNDGDFNLYNQFNTPLLKGVPGFEERTAISGLTFDQNGTLWMASYGATRPILALQEDGTWYSFITPNVKGNQLERIVVDDYDQKWVVIPRVSNQSLLVFNHGQDLASTSDDLYKIYGTGQGKGNLPNSEVYSLAKDLDGEIWVGTAQGIAVFYCASSVFSQSGCEAQQIIVTQNGIAGYLLETERISAIAIDGGNRKWIGTTNGVFLLSPDGTQQVAYYTVDNSPLLSNVITDIAIDHESGEVFIGTNNGIVSIRGEATVGVDEHSDVLIFPNPVREDYNGPIAIKGLANNANVKITDSGGRLFYEAKALGGQAVWDGRNYNGERAKTGVYLVFSSSEDGTSTHVAKLLIIN